MKYLSGNSIFYYLIAIIFLITTLYLPWEIGGETWGYWYFARIYSETGHVVILDRSPLYTLYLNLFSWINYPNSVTIEYIFTSGIVLFALICLFRLFLNKWLSLIAALIWLPYMQFAEPPVQKLALAFSIFSLLIRLNNKIEHKILLSYVLLLVAYLFRATYVLPLITFIIYDIYNKNLKKGYENIKINKKIIILFIFLFILIFWFIKKQSISPLNNVWFADTTWFPSSGKTILDGGFIQGINWFYILEKYGTFIGHDFYITNKEAFNGATNLIDIAIINPEVFIKYIINNIKILPSIITAGIWLPVNRSEGLDYIYSFFIFGIIIYGAFKSTSEVIIKLFIFNSLLLVIVTTLSIPKWRYMMPMIPIFIFSAYWYGKIVSSIINGKKQNPKNNLIKSIASLNIMAVLSLFAFKITDQESRPVLSEVLLITSIILFFVALFLLLIIWLGYENIIGKLNKIVNVYPFLILMTVFCSIEILDWKKLFDKISNKQNESNYKIMESDPFSMKASHNNLIKLTENCKGIMMLETTFLGAFSTQNINSIYSIWEIPPFGKLDDSNYMGLNKNRIDCLLISSNLANGIGAATNIQLRYKNYIKPYANYLKSIGAIDHEISSFGNAIILPN